MDRWVKIYGSLLDWEWADDPNMVALWVHLLLNANYRDKKWHGMTIKRGQFVTSLNTLSERTGISIRSLRTCIERLKQTGEVNEETTNKFRIITICKYESYQGYEDTDRQANDKQTTNKRQTTDKQTTTTLEYKEREEDNLLDNKLSVSMVWVTEFFNEEVVKNNSVFPKVRGLAGKRLGAVKARLREHGEDAVREVISKAVRSDFLNGRNNRGWTANFDWMFMPSNFQKVLEGNYNGRENTEDTGTGSNPLSRATVHTAHIG